MYSKEVIDSILERITPSDLIGRFISLKKQGSDYVACCPFHKEKTPSFHVSDEKGIFHCFGCKKGGNIINFVKEFKNINFSEAIEEIANMYGIVLPKNNNIDEVNRELKETEVIYDINECVCKVFEKNIFEEIGSYCLNYVKKRGLKIADIKKFRIGFALDDYSYIINYLKSLKYTEEQIIKAGVIAKNDNGKYYDKFRNRLMFPILNSQGKVIAFTGRILNDGLPKYLNSPETKIYKKGNTLFNYYYAKNEIHKQNSVVLVEGNMDAISLFVNGVQNVVAPMGTGITKEQILMLWKQVDNIYVCLDGDTAGQKASQRLSKLVLPLITSNKNIKFIFLPKNTDPDDYIRNNGKISFEELLNRAIPLSEYIWNNEYSQFTISDDMRMTPEDRGKLENKIFTLLNTMTDGRLKIMFSQYYKNKLWEASSGYFKRNKTAIKEYDLRNISPENMNEISEIEDNIFKILLRYYDKINEFNEKYKVNIFEIDFSNEDLKKFLALIEDEKNINTPIVKQEINNYINKENYEKFTRDMTIDEIMGLLLKRQGCYIQKDFENALKLGDLDKIARLNEEKLINEKKIKKFQKGEDIF